MTLKCQFLLKLKNIKSVKLKKMPSEKLSTKKLNAEPTLNKKAELDELLDKMRAMRTEPLPDYTIYSKFGGAMLLFLND